jgi:hypothetical protein
MTDSEMTIGVGIRTELSTDARLQQPVHDCRCPARDEGLLVTVVRHDAYAKVRPLQVNVDEPAGQRGYYIHPELYDAPAEKSLAAAHRTQIVQHVNQK